MYWIVSKGKPLAHFHALTPTRSTLNDNDNLNPTTTTFFWLNAARALRQRIEFRAMELETNETKTISIPRHEENHSPVDSDSGSPPQLSAHALAALQEFYAEEAALEMHLKPGQGDAPKLITEDWVKEFQLFIVR